MSRIDLKERINQGTFFIDGAMGTELMKRGTGPGICNDYLSVTSPDTVADVHKAYLASGTDAVITNTFGANAISLKRHNHQDKVEQINIAAAQIARKAAGQDKYVLGDIGPCGDFIEPLGTLKPDQLKLVFAAQAKALAQGGVDAFIVETMTSIEELVIAVQAIKSVSDLPIFASMSFDPAGDDIRTMMGVSVEEAVEKAADAAVDAIGFNCGTLDMPGYANLAERFAKALTGRAIPLLAEANAGRPDLVDDKAVYTLSPEDFAQDVKNINTAGATILGGCCGTSPAHIEAMIKLIRR